MLIRKNFTKMPAAFSLMLLLGCGRLFYDEVGKGEIASEPRRLEVFSNIVIEGTYEISMGQTDHHQVVVSAEENLLEYIKTEVKGNTLYIKNRYRIKSREGIKVHIDYRELSSLVVSGAASVYNEAPIAGDHLKIVMSGAGAIELSLELESLDLSLSGAGAVDLKGSVGKQTIKMSGAGGLDAYNLHSRYCKINISGVGGAKIFVTETLDATISGIGGIDYSGNPANVVTNISGIGKIQRDQDETI